MARRVPKPSTHTEDEKGNHSFWRPKRAISLVLVLFVAAFLFFGYRYIQSPAEGTVHEPEPVPQTEAVSTTMLSGKTFALKYPGNYQPVAGTDSKVTAPTVEQYSLSARSAVENRRISITIRKSPPSLDEESALVFRQRNPEYVSSDEEIAGQKATKLSKKDGTEITYFVPGPNAYAIIATTSTNPRDSYTQEVTDVLKSFKWK